MKGLAFAIGFTVAALGAAAQEAEQPALNLDPAIWAEAGAVAQLMAAQDLFAIARKQSDALAALSAARLMAGVQITQVTRAPTEGTSRAVPAMPLSKAMFDLAKGLALDDGLAVLVETERALPLGTFAQTVQASAGMVAPGRIDRWDLAFYAGALAEIAVTGPGNAVLSIRIMDAGGNLICQQPGPRDRLYCPFVPQENGRFSVLVENPGSEAIAYTILTN